MKWRNKKENTSYQDVYARVVGLAEGKHEWRRGWLGLAHTSTTFHTITIPQNRTHGYHHREKLCRASRGNHWLRHLKMEIKSGHCFKIMSVGGSEARLSGCFRLLYGNGQNCLAARKLVFEDRCQILTMKMCHIRVKMGNGKGVRSELKPGNPKPTQADYIPGREIHVVWLRATLPSALIVNGLTLWLWMVLAPCWVCLSCGPFSIY